MKDSGLAFAGTVLVSIAGMAFHNTREFGWPGLVDWTNGFIPAVAIQLGLLAGWWLAPSVRRGAAHWLGGTAWLQLIAAAVTILPLPILPFVPEQSVDHYVSHVVHGICQLPLILYSRRDMGTEPSIRYP